MIEQELMVDMKLGLNAIMQTAKMAKANDLPPGIIMLNVNRQAGEAGTGYIPITNIPHADEPVRRLVEMMGHTSPAKMAIMMIHPLGRSAYLITTMVNLATFSAGFAILAETHISASEEPHTHSQPANYDAVDLDDILEHL